MIYNAQTDQVQMHSHDEKPGDEIKIPVDGIHKKRKDKHREKHECQHNGRQNEVGKPESEKHISRKRQRISQCCCEQQNAVEDYLFSKLSTLRFHIYLTVIHARKPGKWLFHYMRESEGGFGVHSPYRT